MSLGLLTLKWLGRNIILEFLNFVSFARLESSVTKNMKISKLRKNGRSISFRNGFIRISSIYDSYSFKDIIEDVRIKKILYKKVYKDIFERLDLEARICSVKEFMQACSN